MSEHPRSFEGLFAIPTDYDKLRVQYEALRAAYNKLVKAHALLLDQAHAQASMSASSAVLSFQERLADAIEDMPFGDTAASFSVFVRNFK